MTDRIERLRELAEVLTSERSTPVDAWERYREATDPDTILALLDALEDSERAMRPATDAIDEIIIDESEAQRIHAPDHPMAGVLAGLNRALTKMEAFRRGGEK